MIEPQGSYNGELENAAMPHIQRSGTAESVLPSASMAEVTILLNISPDALIVVDPAGTIVLLNERTAILFRYAQTELIGQPLEKLLPKRLRNAHVAHRTHYAANPRQRPMGADLDLVGRRKNGSEFPIDISLRPILVEQTVHIIGAVRDMTTQRLLERERTQQAERLQQQTALINLAHDAILVRDPISRVLSWNRGAEELYGWSAQEAFGRMAHILLKTRFPINLSGVDAELERAGQWEGELVHTRRDGREVIVESRQVLVRDEQGRPTAVLEINRDISERRRLEQAQNTTYAEAQAQRIFLQQVLDAMPGSIYVVHGNDARLLIANRQAASIWGATWSPGQPMREFLEMYGIEILDGQGRAFPPDVWATMRALQAETVLQHQEVISRPTGDNLPVLVNAVPLVSSHWRGTDAREQRDDDSCESLALVVHHDVRMLKEAEYLKDEFIGIAAHELRTPLAVLKGAASTLVVQTERGHGPQLADWQYETLQELE
ncbi:MAG TPA: PAS domain S-box protein, partial [Ktedonobacteraceae bacterium]|nr:PAS domain S-box protein [Ktedonobacteraceae bacterium]